MKLRDEQLLINKIPPWMVHAPKIFSALADMVSGSVIPEIFAYANIWLSSVIGLFSKLLYMLLKLGPCSPVLSRNWVKLLNRNC